MNPPASRVLKSAAALALSLLTGSCAHGDAGSQSPGVSWCSSIGRLLQEQNVQCLELAGSAALGTFGPTEAPKRYSVDDCFGVGDEGLKILGLRSDTIGEYRTSYAHGFNLEANVGVGLKDLTGLKWAPDIKLSSTGTATVTTSVALLDASWRSISNVGQRVQHRIDQFRFNAEPAGMDTADACKRLQRILCSKDTNELLFPEEVLEARPIITLSSSQSLGVTADVGFDHAGAKVEVKSIGAGAVQLTWAKAIVLGARSNHVNGLMKFDCP